MPELEPVTLIKRCSFPFRAGNYADTKAIENVRTNSFAQHHGKDATIKAESFPICNTRFGEHAADVRQIEL
jgi:hypothetical protein